MKPTTAEQRLRHNVLRNAVHAIGLHSALQKGRHTLVCDYRPRGNRRAFASSDSTKVTCHLCLAALAVRVRFHLEP